MTTVRIGGRLNRGGLTEPGTPAIIHFQGGSPMLRRPLVVALLAAAVTACATPTAPCSRAEDLVKTPLTTASGDTILYVYTCGARLP